MPASASFALTLLGLDGVGRVTAGRLLHHFPTYEALRSTPREQVLLRIKGAPKAEALVAQLFDEAAMQPRLTRAEETLTTLSRQRVTVLTEHHPHWPHGLDDLDRSDRPVVLYAFGDTATLTRPAAALLARPPLDGPSYETAQALAQQLILAGVPVAAGAQHGFDVALQKLCAGAQHPAVLVASAGMARLPKSMRPSVSAVVRAGGVLLTPFPMDHGPFPHDDRERALVQAALARAAAFFAPAPDSAEERAMRWALQHDRPAFGTAGSELLPERVHRLGRTADFDWVLAACGAAGPESGTPE